MSDDSSSSDEQTSRLKEAIDKSLLQNDLYKNDIAEKKHDNQPKPPQSLRNQNHDIFSTNPFSLKVTPEFQKYVSQHLLKLLDKKIDDSKIIKMKKQRKKTVAGGIKLLHTSKKCLNSAKNIEINGNPRKHKVNINRKKIDYEGRAKEVAVSPEWVLSKEEVKTWAPDWKKNVEIVKLGNCKIKEKEKRFCSMSKKSWPNTIHLYRHCSTCCPDFFAFVTIPQAHQVQMGAGVHPVIMFPTWTNGGDDFQFHEEAQLLFA